MGCQKEEFKSDPETVEQTNANLQASTRAYAQDECGFVEKFCSEQEKPLPASIEDDLIKFRVNDNFYQAFPIKMYDGNVGIFVIEGNNAYVMHKNNNPKLSEKNTSQSLPKELGALLAIDYQNNFDRNNIYSRIEQEFGKSLAANAEGRKEMDISDTPQSGLNSFEAVTYCNAELVSNVDDFLEVFYGNSQDDNLYNIIENAFTNGGCPAAYPDYYDGDLTKGCSNNCIDPRCIVDYLLALDEGLDDNQKHLIIARYLSETIELTDDEQAWLEDPENTEFARSIYDGFAVDRGIDRCTGTDCGILGGYHELIIQTRADEILTSQETEGLLDFFSVMRCDDEEIYSCFREAQKNPESGVATFLNSVKAEVMMDNFALLNECIPAQYADRWYELATLDASSVEEVIDRLSIPPANTFWIQTLENAQPSTISILPVSPFAKWWIYSPTVNLDYFALTINTLPKNPVTDSPFENPLFFYNYLRSEWTDSDFAGEGNGCATSLPNIPAGNYFAYLGSPDPPLWADLVNPKGAAFTISLADDGSVITSDSEYYINNTSSASWTFSTLNAPGLFNGDNMMFDGYHPVSGNRQFGIETNGQGQVIYYVTGVDRLTGWWHALTAEDQLTNGYEDADNFWNCHLNKIKTFVTDNEGTVENNFECINVRPKYSSLREKLSRGCEGFITSINSFDCEQASACE